MQASSIVVTGVKIEDADYKLIIKDVNIEIKRGNFIAILGE